ncbi:ribosome biogenesis ATPase RIX7 [Cryptosporidium felis]|nr:ribosome biogenesis ATPase RIX7 [Cryptosporidium felis]
MSGLLVAATTNTFLLSPTPSNSVSNWFTTLSVAPFPSLLLAAQSESNSSKNTIQGAEALALSKTVRTAFSDSPTYLLRSSGPLILIKFAPLSLAIAFAKRVFPQPGGP